MAATKKTTDPSPSTSEKPKPTYATEVELLDQIDRVLVATNNLLAHMGREAEKQTALLAEIRDRLPKPQVFGEPKK